MALLQQDSDITMAALMAIAHMPTSSLSALCSDAFFHRLTDRDFMRIAVLLAEKAYKRAVAPLVP